MGKSINTKKEGKEKTKGAEKTNALKIDLNLLQEKIKQNGHLFSISKKKRKSKFSLSAPKSAPSPQPTAAPSSKSKPALSTGKIKIDEVKGPDKKTNENKTAVSKGKGAFEQHVDDFEQGESEFSVGFEPTRDVSPIIQERKEQPVKNMEQFLETVPSPRKKEKEEGRDKLYEAVDENYRKSYESNYSGERWDEDRVANEIKENLQRFDHPGHFREVRLIQDQALRKDRFSEAAKYDLEVIDRTENEQNIFRPAFERKYKTRGKL